MRSPLIAAALTTLLAAGCFDRRPEPALALPPPPPSGSKTENFDYTRWAKFKPGTVAVVRKSTFS